MYFCEEKTTVLKPDYPQLLKKESTNEYPFVGPAFHATTIMIVFLLEVIAHKDESLDHLFIDSRPL